MSIKIKKVNTIDVDDWDNLVQKTYGKPYSLQQQDGCMSRGTVNITIPDEEIYDDEMHDSIIERVNGPEMGVKFKKWLERDPKKSLEGDTSKWGIEMFWERNFYPDLQTVVNDLHAKKLIPAGDYSIIIDW